jgi:predicted dehydrogenase
MYNLAVIGLGQLGKRHLQSLVNLPFPTIIHIVDPSPNSIASAREMIDDSSIGSNILVVSHEEIETLPEFIDLAIIATTSDVRFAVLQKLCAHTSVKNLILEKVLFQKYSHYQKAVHLINRQGIQSWVNCPRRINSYYLSIKEFFANESIKFMSVCGGNWGLGCNSIHFLDLLSFLIDRTDLVINGTTLTQMKSKRSGFLEYTGTINGRLNESTFTLTSVPDTAKHIVTLVAERKSVIIDEVGGYFWQIDDTLNLLKKFSMPYQSQMTALVAESILVNGTCGLTPIDDSIQLHLPLIEVLSFCNPKKNEEMLCQVT